MAPDPKAASDVGRNPAPSDDAGTAGTQKDAEPTDFLLVHSKVMAGALGALAIVIVAASLLTTRHRGLPSIAFGWFFGLAVARAAVAFAIIGAIVVLLVRGWGGVWPQRLGTTGVDFPPDTSGAKDITQGTTQAIEIMREILRLQGGISADVPPGESNPDG